MNWLICCSSLLLEGFIFCAYYTDLSYVMHFFLLLIYFHAFPFISSSISIYFYLQQCGVPENSLLHSWEQAKQMRHKEKFRETQSLILFHVFLLNPWSFDSPHISLSIQMSGICLQLACSPSFYSAAGTSTLQKMIFLFGILFCSHWIQRDPVDHFWKSDIEMKPIFTFFIILSICGSKSYIST